MRLLASAALFLGSACASSFSVLSEDPGAWPRILSSIGLQPQSPKLSKVFVLRPGSPASAEWRERVEKGAFVVLEGESPLAEMFGFVRGKENVRVGSLIDVHGPKLPIIWKAALELPRFEIPKESRVFARERWTGTPVTAGFRRGSGAVLWVAVSPGEHGYERFPYLLQALADLGLQAPFRSGRLWAFFDSSYRSRVDLEYMAERWRSTGIAALHVAAWHFYDPDPERDEYLRKLIDACHRKAVLVYAWLELPHVSEKFWADHPAWRERTAANQDAQLDWRKLMNLSNRDCFREVVSGVKNLITGFDWDGVNLAELYFESLEGASNPARFTPMNDEVRALFRQANGVDPIELFRTRTDADSLRKFLDFRAELAGRMQEEWMAELDKIRRDRPNLDIVLTHVDDRFDTAMRDAIGADAARVLPMLARRDFTFLIEDPATVWHLGPHRYPEIARRYRQLTARTDRLAIDINVAERYQDVYPTRQQTGIELFQLVHLASGAFSRVALYGENSILPPDLVLLSSAAAVATKSERIGARWIVDSRFGVGVPWAGPALVDGKLWPIACDGVVWLPAGTHTVEPAQAPHNSRVLDFNGDLESAQILNDGRIELSYQSPSRAMAVLERKPMRLEIDGVASVPQAVNGNVLYLPRGQHLVIIQTE